jgi:1,2-diacylglycerol 3-alpha-glucosyltransferase
MRVGIVTATYAPSRNGVATSTALFVRGLRALGHEVRVFAPAHPAAQPEAGVTRLASTRLFSPPDYPLMLPPTPWLARSLPLQGLEVLHTMHPFLAGRLTRHWAAALGVPWVFTAHTQYHAYAHYAPLPTGWTRRYLSQHVPNFARAAHRVLTPGSAMETALRADGFDGAIERLPNPVDLGTFNGVAAAEVRAELGLPPDSRYLVYVGRMAPEKGIERLLQAFAQVRRQHPKVALVMVGDGPLLPKLRAQAGEGVHYLGSRPNDTLPSLLAAAELFVSASSSEVLPMTFLEALASGTPVAAVASDAARDLLAPHGWMADNTPEALAALIDTLLQADRASLRKQARTAAEPFAVEKRAAALVDIYARVMDEHAAATRNRIMGGRA